jgi:hypothetical protein
MPERIERLCKFYSVKLLDITERRLHEDFVNSEEFLGDL